MPEEKRKREWDESCRQETVRVRALAEDAQRKREAEQRRLQEDEHKKQEATRKQQELQQRRDEFYSSEFHITAAFDKFGLSNEERTQVEDMLTRLGLWTTPMVAVERATVFAMEIAAER
jgi:hypothetical protein